MWGSLKIGDTMGDLEMVILMYFHGENDDHPI